MDKLIQINPQAFDEFKQNAAIIRLDTDENPMEMRKPYYGFYKNVEVLNYVKHLQGNNQSYEQLTLYQSIGKKYEVKRVFYPYSYDEIIFSSIFDNPSPQVNEFLQKAFQEYYKMKLSCISSHGIQPLKFNIVIAPQNSFNFLFCEFIFEHIPNSFGNIVNQKTSFSKKSIVDPTFTLNYFLQILEALIPLEESNILARIDLSSDVVVEDPKSTYQLILLKNINSQLEKVQMEPLFPFPNLNLENSIIEMNKIESLKTNGKGKQFSDLIHQLALFMLKFFNVYKELNLNKNDSEFNGIQETPEKLQNFQNIMLSQISSLPISLEKNLLELIKEIIETSFINLEKAKEIYNTLQNLNNKFNSKRNFRDPDEFLKIGQENVLRILDESKMNESLDINQQYKEKEALNKLYSSNLFPEDKVKDPVKIVLYLLNNLEKNANALKEIEELKNQIWKHQELSYIASEKKFHTNEIDSVKHLGQQVQERIATLEKELILKNQEIEVFRNKCFDVEKKLKQVQNQNHSSPNLSTINPNLENLNKCLERELKGKDKQCQELQSLLDQKSIENYQIKQELEKIMKQSPKLENKGNISQYQFETSQTQKIFNETSLQEKDIELKRLKETLMDEKKAYEDLNKLYQKMKVELLQFKKKENASTYEYNSSKLNQEDSQSSKIHPSYSLVQPMHQENFQNQYILASQKIGTLEAQIPKLNQELSRNASQESSINSTHTQTSSTNPEKINQMNEGLFKDKREIEQLTGNIQTMSWNFEKLNQEFKEYKALHPEKSKEKEAHFEILLAQMANIGFKLSNTAKSFREEFTRLLEEYKNMRNRNNAPITSISYEGKKYIGMVTNGKPNGFGRMEYPEGSTFTGFFIDGKKDGSGVLINKTINLKYCGGFKDNMFHGYGILMEESGSGQQTRCYGLFANGKMNGSGITYFPDGGIYQGNYVEGKKSGYGIYTSDKLKYEGFWNNDLMDGNGTYYLKDLKNLKDKNEIYEGEFIKGRFHGTFYHTKGSQVTIEKYDSGNLVNKQSSPDSLNVGKFNNLNNLNLINPIPFQPPFSPLGQSSPVVQPNPYEENSTGSKINFVKQVSKGQTNI